MEQVYTSDLDRDSKEPLKHGSNSYSKGGLIKPSHRGLLHKDLGIPQGEKIPTSRLESAKSGASPAEKKRIVFAENFGHRKG